MRETDLSALGPVDPDSVPSLDESENKSPWIVRKILGVSKSFILDGETTGPSVTTHPTTHPNIWSIYLSSVRIRA